MTDNNNVLKDIPSLLPQRPAIDVCAHDRICADDFLSRELLEDRGISALDISTAANMLLFSGTSIVDNTLLAEAKKRPSPKGDFVGVLMHNGLITGDITRAKSAGEYEIGLQPVEPQSVDKYLEHSNQTISPDLLKAIRVTERNDKELDPDGAIGFTRYAPNVNYTEKGRAVAAIGGTREHPIMIDSSMGKAELPFPDGRKRSVSAYHVSLKDSERMRRIVHEYPASSSDSFVGVLLNSSGMVGGEIHYSIKGGEKTFPIEPITISKYWEQKRAKNHASPDIQETPQAIDKLEYEMYRVARDKNMLLGRDLSPGKYGMIWNEAGMPQGRSR